MSTLSFHTILATDAPTLPCIIGGSTTNGPVMRCDVFSCRDYNSLLSTIRKHTKGEDNVVICVSKPDGSMELVADTEDFLKAKLLAEKADYDVKLVARVQHRKQSENWEIVDDDNCVPVDTPVLKMEEVGNADEKMSEVDLATTVVESKSIAPSDAVDTMSALEKKQPEESVTPEKHDLIHLQNDSVVSSADHFPAEVSVEPERREMPEFSTCGSESQVNDSDMYSKISQPKLDSNPVKESRENTETNKDDGFSSGFISEAFKEIENLLTVDSNAKYPKQTKFSELVSNLSGIVTELLKDNVESFNFLKSACDDETAEVETELEQLRAEDLHNNEKFISIIKKIGADEKVVQNLQTFISSKVVCDLVTDLCRNDCRTQSEFKSILLNHLGCLLPEVGKFLQQSPQFLVLLPEVLKRLANFLSEEVVDQAVKVGVDLKLLLHENIMCDACTDSFERKTASLREGHCVNNNIAGIRYKSATKEDFDLCETCEASGDFDMEFGPFLKIKNPKLNVKEVFFVFDERKEYARLQPTKLESHVEGTLKLPSDVTPKKEETGVLRCPRKDHVMKEFYVPNRLFACDVCDQRPKTLSVMFGCRICDYDVCLKCAKNQNKSFEFVEDPAAIERPNHACRGTPIYARPAAPHIQLKPRSPGFKMKFVRDETAFDGIVLKPGQKFQKVWKVQNNSDHVSWPAMTRVVCVSKDLLGAKPDGEMVVSLPPKAIGTIMVNMVAPKHPGRYTSFWRLTAPCENGQTVSEKFGDRLWVDIVVGDGV